MPVLIVPALVAAGIGVTAATIIAYAIVIGALIAAETLLMPKPKNSASGQSGNSVQYPTQQMVRSSIANRNIAYGTVPVGGIMVYLQQGGYQNQYLDIVSVHTDHEIDSYLEFHLDNYIIFFDGNGNSVSEKDVNTGVATTRMAGLIYLEAHKGVADDPASPGLIANSAGAWTSTCKLGGCAYTYWRLKYDSNAFSGGIPNLSVIMRGRKVYDPRDSSHAWSDNAALCILDYMMDTKYGFRAPYAEFDSGYLMTAIAACDDNIGLVGGGSEKRYTINGVIDVGTSPGQVLDTMLGAMAGKCPWVGGFFYMQAGVWQTPTVTLTENDLRKMPTLSTKLSIRDTCNGCKGTFCDPNSNWQASDFPPYTNATYFSDDNNIRYWVDLTLPMTTSPARAQRIAKILVERTRAGQVVLTMPCKLTGMQCQLGDNVMVTLDRFGYTNQLFEITGFEFVSENDVHGTPCIGVDILLRGAASEAFNWNLGEQNPYEPSPVSTLPNPFIVVNPIGLTLESDSSTVLVANDGTIIPRLLVSWTAPVDQFVLSGGYIQIQYKQHGTSTWLDWDQVPGSQTFDYITNVTSNVQYDVRIRSINSLPIANPQWVSSTDGTTVAGAPSAPGNITNLGGVGLPLGVQFNWVNPTDPNFGYTKLYTSTIDDFNTASVWFVGLGTETKIPNLASGIVIYAWARPFNTSSQGGNVTAVAFATAQDAVQDGSITNPKLGSPAVDTGNVFQDAISHLDIAVGTPNQGFDTTIIVINVPDNGRIIICGAVDFGEAQNTEGGAGYPDVGTIVIKCNGTTLLNMRGNAVSYAHTPSTGNNTYVINARPATNAGNPTYHLGFLIVER